MKADEFFQPLFSRARRVATPREYRFGGAFLGVMAVMAVVVDGLSGWPGVVAFGIPAIGAFRLARRVEENPTLPPDEGAA